jgi:tRNA threonylcarbamoyladenosine biosynthesis protein TsaE
MTVEVNLPTRRATIRLARRLAPHLRGGDLVVLAGSLGAGKTFFTRALCRAFGLPERVAVTSPTFTLVHELETDPPVAHADVYRLEQPSAVRELGLDAMRDDGYVVLVEWGAPFIDLLGGDALVVALELVPGRRAVIRATGPRSEQIAAALA